MFPSSGHFKFLHCPFHLEGKCGRIYCHFRHVKNADEKSGENTELQTLEKQISSALRLDKETFRLLVDEEDENIHEKLLNKKFKTRFPGCDVLIDDLHIPESTDDFNFPSSTSLTDQAFDDYINLTDDTPLDEGPLKQFLEEDAKQSSNSEHKNRNTIEKRHIIISCLEKIDRRPVPERTLVNDTKIAPTGETENTDDVMTQRVNPADSPDLSRTFKEENESDNSDTEVNAEVDKILSQMELLNPQLFNVDDDAPLKNEPLDNDDESRLDMPSQETIFNASSNSQQKIPFLSEDNEELPLNSFLSSSTSPSSHISLVGRINLKSIQAINNEVSSDVTTSHVKSEEPFTSVFKAPGRPEPNPVVLAATLAEQNRLKNVFKNTICSNIDQFFDLSDACKVYGTEIFNLLEPLLNYLIEKLNPEFNFQKLHQLHSQNISLSCGLPFVISCEHMKDCMECHNILLSAMTRSKIKKFDKSTATDSGITSSSNDIPLRNIEANLYNLTNEMLSLGIPVSNEINIDKPSDEMKNGPHQTESSLRQENSHHRHSDRKRSRDVDKHKSRHKSSSKDKIKKDKHEVRKHSSSSRHSHSRSEHRSSRSSTRKHEKRRKETEGDKSCDDEYDSMSKRRRSSKADEAERKKCSSSDRVSAESKKTIPAVTKSKSKHESEKMKKAKDETSSEKNENSNDSDMDGEPDIFGAPLSDGYSESESEDDSRSANEKQDYVVPDISDSDLEGKQETNNSEEFTDRYPSTANKKRVSHVSESNSSQVYRKPVVPKKHILTPQEALHQRIHLAKKVEEAPMEISTSSKLLSNSSDKVRISHVPNVALLLKAKEQLKAELSAVPQRTLMKTAHKGVRVAHNPVEPPKPKDVPAHALNSRPKIKEFKSSHNIPLHIRQNGLDRLFNALAKKIPPEVASELALKEEQTIHEKVTIQKVYLNSLAMAIHRIIKEDAAKLIVKPSEFPLEINGFAVYDLLNNHILTLEQMEINGFPIGIPDKPGCAIISTKAIHYKPLTSKRNGDRFYCQQCKELFEMCPESGLPITPVTGCRFHTLRLRKEYGRTRHDMYYPCCKKSVSESGCVTAAHHTPDMTDDDCLEGFVETRDASPGERDGMNKFYSLDCEMCYTTFGSELTRVTIIGHDCNIVYDSLVKPRNKILDYCTKWSGITEEKMRRATKSLKQIQHELFKFIFKDTILIGHSLENDLKALKILHYKIVDTSVMYPHRDAPERKFSLKNLSSTVVQFLIQESEFGHDSMEDALACMKLVWKKIREDAQLHRPKKIMSSPAKSS